jgi:hypothetical protein
VSSIAPPRSRIVVSHDDAGDVYLYLGSLVFLRLFMF